MNSSLLLTLILLLMMLAEATAAEYSKESGYTVVIAIIQILPPTLMSLAALVAALKGLRQGKENAVKADSAKIAAVQVAEKADQLARKVEDHSNLVNEKLDSTAAKLEVNTEATISGASKAAQAYSIANNYNQRFLELDEEMRDFKQSILGGLNAMMAELERQGRNSHHLKNALTVVTGTFDWEDKPEPPSGKKT